MKQNIKLFLTSLVSNNACIDGARKKPWYAAIIIFFISLILSVVPTTVLELKKHGDKNFDSNTYELVEATHEFSGYLNTLGEDEFFIEREEKTGRLVATETVNKEFTIRGAKFAFAFVEPQNMAAREAQYKAANTSYFVFSDYTLDICVLDPNSPDGNSPKVTLSCRNAYKKLSKNAFKEAYVEGTSSEALNSSWKNWKGLIRKLYNQTRLAVAGVQLGICSAINFGVALIMGFMVWVLTRGKNNPYRLFSVWECFKIAAWTALTPALLTSGLGFLIKGFAAMIFPLLYGVRVMWLSMKSLRPDGSGYAAD